MSQRKARVVRADAPRVLRPPQTDAERRKLLAQLIIEHGLRIGAIDADAQRERALSEDLSPREIQTLRRLLAGESEKQAAAALGVSQHTVHVYVKSLYKHFGVSSRPELLSKCLGGND